MITLFLAVVTFLIKHCNGIVLDNPGGTGGDIQSKESKDSSGIGTFLIGGLTTSSLNTLGCLAVILIIFKEWWKNKNISKRLSPFKRFSLYTSITSLLTSLIIIINLSYSSAKYKSLTNPGFFTECAGLGLITTTVIIIDMTLMTAIGFITYLRLCKRYVINLGKFDWILGISALIPSLLISIIPFIHYGYGQDIYWCLITRDLTLIYSGTSIMVLLIFIYILTIITLFCFINISRRIYNVDTMLASKEFRSRYSRNLILSRVRTFSTELEFRPPSFFMNNLNQYRNSNEIPSIEKQDIALNISKSTHKLLFYIALQFIQNFPATIYFVCRLYEVERSWLYTLCVALINFCGIVRTFIFLIFEVYRKRKHSSNSNDNSSNSERENTINNNIINNFNDSSNHSNPDNSTNHIRCNSDNSSNNIRNDSNNSSNNIRNDSNNSSNNIRNDSNNSSNNIRNDSNNSSNNISNSNNSTNNIHKNNSNNLSNNTRVNSNNSTNNIRNNDSNNSTNNIRNNDSNNSTNNIRNNDSNNSTNNIRNNDSNNSTNNIRNNDSSNSSNNISNSNDSTNNIRNDSNNSSNNIRTNSNNSTDHVRNNLTNNIRNNSNNSSNNVSNSNNSTNNIRNNSNNSSTNSNNSTNHVRNNSTNKIRSSSYSNNHIRSNSYSNNNIRNNSSTKNHVRSNSTNHIRNGFYSNNQIRNKNHIRNNSINSVLAYPPSSYYYPSKKSHRNSSISSTSSYYSTKSDFDDNSNNVGMSTINENDTTNLKDNNTLNDDNNNNNDVNIRIPLEEDDDNESIYYEWCDDNFIISDIDCLSIFSDQSIIMNKNNNCNSLEITNGIISESSLNIELPNNRISTNESIPDPYFRYNGDDFS